VTAARWAWAALAGAAFGLGLLAVVAVGADRTGRSVSFFTRDPLAELHAPLYTGVVSTVGALVWWSGGVVALAAALALGSRRPAFAPLLALAALTLALAFDDLFLVHEEVLPDIVGIPEKAVYAAYALAGAAFVVVFRPFLAKPPRLPALAAAVLLLGLSIFFDVVAPGRHLLEDGAKLLGIVAWTIFAAGVSLDELAALTGRRAPVPEPR
jgi:hypothetical protein